MDDVRGLLQPMWGFGMGVASYPKRGFFYFASRASLHFDKDRKNIDSFRRFIEKFSLFWNEVKFYSHLRGFQFFFPFCTIGPDHLQWQSRWSSHTVKAWNSWTSSLPIPLCSLCQIPPTSQVCPPPPRLCDWIPRKILIDWTNISCRCDYSDMRPEAHQISHITYFELGISESGALEPVDQYVTSLFEWTSNVVREVEVSMTPQTSSWTNSTVGVTCLSGPFTLQVSFTINGGENQNYDWKTSFILGFDVLSVGLSIGSWHCAYRVLTLSDIQCFWRTALNQTTKFSFAKKLTLWEGSVWWWYWTLWLNADGLELVQPLSQRYKRPLSCQRHIIGTVCP